MKLLLELILQDLHKASKSINGLFQGKKMKELLVKNKFVES